MSQIRENDGQGIPVVYIKGLRLSPMPLHEFTGSDIAKMKFSVIMPVRNRAHIIKASVESVLAQSFKDYELLIVDDGSDDALEDALRPFLSDNVVYHRRPHEGVCAARNYGLQQAGGEYIAYLDSDNSWRPDFLLKMHKALTRSKPQRQTAYCRCDRLRRDPESGKFVLDSVVGRKFDFKRLVAGNFIDLNTFVHARRCLDGQSAFDENLKRMTDWDFILKITSRHEPVFVRDILVDYHLDLAEDTISNTEDLVEPLVTIKQRFSEFDDRNVTIEHDAIWYSYENVPDKKYYNYLRTFHGLNCKTEDFAARGFPYILQVEPTNACNLSCAVCPAAADKKTLDRPRRNMSLDEFKSVVDDMRDYLLLLVLWDWGEPFMNPQLPDMIRYARDKGIRTVTSTNAHFLHDREYLERILTSGLTTLIVAVDSLKPEKYESYRKGGDLTKVLDGLRNVLAMKKELNSETLINLRMVIMNSNEDELRSMRTLAKKLGVDYFTVKTANPTPGGNSSDEGIVPRNPAYRRYAYKPGTYERIRMDVNCRKCWFLLNVHSNGVVAGCCYDYDQEMAVGNVFERPFTEIWNGPAARALRKKLYYDKDTMDKCRECDVNFKLRDVGWFVEVRDFNADLKTRMNRIAKRLARRIFPKRVVELLRSRQ